MSFLDSLENNLKALESREERGAVRREPTAREREQSRSARPFAEQLRRSDFTRALLDQVVTIAHGLRTKVYINWIGTTLRLDAREHRLELQPQPDGIVAVFQTSGRETARQPVDLGGDPEKLARVFLSRIEAPAKRPPGPEA